MTSITESGEIKLVSPDFEASLLRLRSAGMRLDCVYPADAPHGALLSDGKRIIRLEAAIDAPRPASQLPCFRPERIVTRAGGDDGAGRAGMRYRDLLPGRLGGRYIASHIRIPGSGPVDDWVHYHHVAFQLIAVRRGRVLVVYDGQGEPFWMEPGDIVLQPPTIRHRVIESQGDLEVVEVGCPALHATFADHHMALPGDSGAGGLFGGQRFCLHRASDSAWVPFGGGEMHASGIAVATGGLGDARLVRPLGGMPIDFPAGQGELDFGFVMEGRATLAVDDFSVTLGPCDSFAIPPGTAWRIAPLSPDLLLLNVTTSRIGEGAGEGARAAP